MKVFVALVLSALAIFYFYEPNYKVDDFTDINAPAVNPLRNAPLIVTTEAAKPLDFSELDQPFSKDAVDTEIAGQLRVGEDGNLIVDGQLKAYFDYFLSSVGLVTPEQAIRRLHLLFAKNLPEDAALQAMTTLEGYLAFKEASFDFLANPIDNGKAQNDVQYRVNQLEYALNGLKDLRREYMDPQAADAFFQEDEAFADYTLATQKIAINGELTVLERRELRAQARSNLPVEMAEIAQQQEARAHTQQGLQALLNDSASQEEVAQYAYEHFSPEEAKGIVEHHQQDIYMKQQYSVYRDQVEQLQTQGLSEQDLAQAKQDLMGQYFNEEQASMIQAWDLAGIE